jgi:hypothetical protein
VTPFSTALLWAFFITAFSVWVYVKGLPDA